MGAQTHPLVSLSFFSPVSLVWCISLVLFISFASYISFIIVSLVIIFVTCRLESARAHEGATRCITCMHWFAARARYEQAGACATCMDAAASRMILEHSLHMQVCVLHDKCVRHRTRVHVQRARVGRVRWARHERAWGRGMSEDETRHGRGRGRGRGEAEADMNPVALFARAIFCAIRTCELSAGRVWRNGKKNDVTKIRNGHDVTPNDFLRACARFRQL